MINPTINRKKALGRELAKVSNNIVVRSSSDLNATQIAFAGPLVKYLYQSFDQVTKQGATSSFPITVYASGSVFNTFQTTGDLLVGTNLRVLGTIESVGKLTSGEITSTGDIRSFGNIHVNLFGPESADGRIYFYSDTGAGASSTASYLGWNTSITSLVLSTNTLVSGDFTAINLKATSDVYVNFNGSDGDSSLFFYDASSPTGQSIMWDESETEFVLSSICRADDFRTSNTAVLQAEFKSSSSDRTDIRILNTGTGDAVIFFDAANGDISGGDYASIGQLNDLNFEFNLQASAGSFKMNRGLDVGDGGSTNYTSIADDGEINLIGTARVRKEVVFNVSMAALSGTNVPTAEEIAIGGSGAVVAPVLSFDPAGTGGNDQEVFIVIHMPCDVDDSVNVEFQLMWKPHTNWASGNYIWKLDYLVKTNISDLTTETPTTIAETVTPSNSTDMIETVFSSTIDANAENIIFGRLYLDTASTATTGWAGHVMFTEIEYTSNKLGVAT